MAPTRSQPRAGDKRSSRAVSEPSRTGPQGNGIHRVSESGVSQQHGRYNLRTTVKTSQKARDAAPSLPHRVLRGTNMNARSSTQVRQYTPIGPSPLSATPASAATPSPESHSPVRSDHAVDEHTQAEFGVLLKNESDDDWLRNFHMGRQARTSGEDVETEQSHSLTESYPHTPHLTSPLVAARHSIEESDDDESLGRVEASDSSRLIDSETRMAPNHIQASSASGGPSASQQFKYLSVVRSFQRLHSLRLIASREYIYNSSVDSARPLVLYWMGRKLIGIYNCDRTAAGWLYEDSDFLMRATENPDITDGVDRVFQAQVSFADAKSPRWPGKKC